MLDKQSVGRKGNQEKNHKFSQGKKTFEKPKLTFIEPELNRQGDATKITAGFFGSFVPE